MVYLIYLHYWPRFTDPFTLKVETFNEVIFIVMCYHMVLFSNLVWVPATKQTLGLSLISLIALLLGVNTLIILIVSVKQVLRNRRLKHLKGLRSESIEQRKVAHEVVWAAGQLNENVNRVQESPQLYKAITVELAKEGKEADRICRTKFTNSLAKIAAQKERRLCGRTRKAKVTEKEKLAASLRALY